MAQRQFIIRRKLLKDTRIQNAIIWDESISLMARFSLIAMLSLPDSWDYSVRGMAAMLKVSKDTMGKYIKELEEAGYLQRRQAHSDAGKFGSAQYILTDTPHDFGEGDAENCPNFSDTVEPDTVEPDPEKSPQKKRSSEQKRRTEEYPPKAPQGATGKKPRQNKYALQEDAKPLLRDYVGEDRELHQALADFILIRQELRAINSKRAIAMLLRELDELSGGDRQTKLQLIRQSCTNSWKSVFPLKGPRASPADTAPPEPEVRNGWR